MSFDNLFEKGYRHHKPSHGNHYGSFENNNYPRQHDQSADIKRIFFEKIQNNPKIKVLIVIVAIVLLLLIILAAILLMPLILKLFRALSENGIQGILNTIWNGSK
jgi:hypothetical protein